MSTCAHLVVSRLLIVHNMDMGSSSAPGAQLVGRVGAVLRAVSTAMPAGMGTGEVAAATGLTRPTAHRILSSLAADGFIDRDAHRGHWYLGPELYLMGAVAAERYDITEIARPAVRELSQRTGESAFLSARRGDETVCLLREDGAFPIRSHVLYEGVRFPLGVASAGLAILSYLPEPAIERYLTGTDLQEQYGPSHATEPLRRRIAATRATGWAVNPGLVVEGSWGMGAVVFDAAGAPAWALSLTGVEARFGPARRPDLGRLLLDQAHRLSQRVAARNQGGRAS